MLRQERKAKRRAGVREAYDGLVALCVAYSHVIGERVAEAVAARAPAKLLESAVASRLQPHTLVA